MALPETPSPPHLYPQAIQLKLYQAFIFSIPILFSIILFLLFYLFYLKRRASTLSSPPPILPRTLNQAAPLTPMPFEKALKGKLKEKLPIILFDEDLRAKDSQCCVCLGEFEIKEELLQVPSCRHVFHVDCLNHWLRSNSTCPLCRCSVFSTAKIGNPEPPSGPQLVHQDSHNSNHHPEIVLLEQQQQQQQQQMDNNFDFANLSREVSVIQVDVEGSSSTMPTCVRDSGGLSEFSSFVENEMGIQIESVDLDIQTHSS